MAAPARKYDALHGVRVSPDKGVSLAAYRPRTGGGPSYTDGRPSRTPCPSASLCRVSGTLTARQLRRPEMSGPIRPDLQTLAVAVHGRLPCAGKDTPLDPLVLSRVVTDRRYPAATVSVLDKTPDIAFTGIPRTLGAHVLFET